MEVCDICNRRAKFKGMGFAKCCKCGVGVHTECYGIGVEGNGEDAPTSFECWACQSVGKRFQINDRDPTTGQRVRVLQTERPTSCELCSVRGGIHAMHPLFDNHGMSGRQMKSKQDDVNNNNPVVKLAWVHTLCAVVLASKASVVYGCLRDGYYETDGTDDDYLDDRSANSELEEIEDETESGVNTVHHYVYCLPRGGKQNPWTKYITKNQNSLKCFLCGAPVRALQ
jgi:hypothetical protein